MLDTSRVGSDILLATDEYIVRNTSQEIVPLTCGNDSTEAVLEVVTASGLKIHPVSLEPSTPECTPQPIDMAVEGSSSVIPR